MRLGVDFDRVLFNTDEFNRHLENETGLHHVDEDVYDEDGCYSPEKHAEACGIDVEDVYATMRNLNQFLYSDVDKLKELKPEHELVIVTRGEEKIQKKKVKNSGAERLFDEVFVVQGASKDIVDIDFLIDDRKEEIKSTSIPGMVFDRDEHGAEDIVEQVRELET